jgi:hypothetical protein
MPTSDIGSITPIMQTIVRLNPKRVLDLGLGWGKYGALAREYLDVEQGRFTPDQWQTQIIGVEGFSPYIDKTPNLLHYTEVWNEDFTENYEEYFGFDLILMIDSLEHVPKPLGQKMLDYLLLGNKNVLVSCPFGQNYLEQGAVFGNELERHKAHWQPEEFEVMGGRIIYKGVCVVALLKGAS